MRNVTDPSFVPVFTSSSSFVVVVVVVVVDNDDVCFVLFVLFYF